MSLTCVRATHRLSVDEAMTRYAATGDPDAFAALYALVGPRLHAYLVRQTRDRAHAEDLAQQTLLQAHRARARFVPGSDALAWLLAIARHLVIDSARAAHRRAALGGGPDPGASLHATRADELLHARQLARRIEMELGRLPERQRAAFELWQAHRSMREVAGALGISVGAAKVRLHRAHRQLRTALKHLEHAH